MGKAAIYVRVSTSEQATSGVSLADQESRLRAYAQAQGLTVVEVVGDRGVSGSIPLGKRRGGARLIELLEQRAATHVLIAKLDRAFRDASDSLATTRDFEKAGVSLHILDMGGSSLNTASPSGRFMLTIMSGFAEMERALLRDRVASAIAHKRASGQVYGPIPLGYDRDGDRLTENASESAVVARIQSMRTEGLSYVKIAERLNQDAVPTKKGKRWHSSTVRNVALRGS